MVRKVTGVQRDELQEGMSPQRGAGACVSGMRLWRMDQRCSCPLALARKLLSVVTAVPTSLTSQVFPGTLQA